MKPLSFIDNIKIRNKIIAMCAIVIVPVFVAGIFLLFSIINIQKNNAVNDAYNSADSLKTRLIDMIYTTMNVAERVYANDSVMSFLLSDSLSKEEIKNFYANNNTLNEYVTAYSQISSIKFYIDKQDFIYNSQFRKANSSIKNSYWYRSAAEGNGRVIWDVVRNPSDNKVYLSLVKGIYDSKNNCIGVMVIAINSEWLDGILKDNYNNAIFSVKDFKVFYSNIDGIELGNVLSSASINEYNPSNFRYFEKNSTILDDSYTIIESFEYESTGNLFQIFLVKPYSEISVSTKNITKVYLWYMSCCFLLSILSSFLLASLFSRRVQFLKNQMHNVALGDFSMDYEISGHDEINELNDDLNIMVQSMRKLIDEAYEAKILSETMKLNQMEAEFKALSSQINPHFLYNTLETIRMKAYCNNDKETADLIKKLGKFMRRCLEIKDSSVTLKSELEFINSYLELQSVRFGDRVSYSIYSEVDPNHMILPLIIQPIVENAFVHGIEGCKANGHISIKVLYRDVNIVICVQDNGQGISDENMAILLDKLKKNNTSSGKSIGLTNVNKRIKMYHGEQYGLKISSIEEKGTTIEIVIPRY